jgi:hypothetical protein
VKTVAELRETSAEAADVFEKADADRRAQRFDDARAGYQRAAELAPKSPHPLRRLCTLALEIGPHDDADALAVSYCRKARGRRDDDLQRQTLALALATPASSDADVAEAYRLADAAAYGNDPFAYDVLCAVSDRAASAGGLERCSKALRRLAPDSSETWVYTAMDAAIHERFGDAKEAIAKARDLGATNLDDLEAAIDEHTPIYERYGGALEKFLLGWISLLAFVIVAGVLLSAVTRSAARRIPPERTGHARGLTRVVRLTYRFVLWLACLLFYVSLPVMLTATIGVAVGLVYLSFAVGRIPVHLLVVVGTVTLVTIGATLKSLFVRVKNEDPGMRLDLSQHPALDAVLEAVAAKVGTRKVDTVFLTTGTDFGVFERGGIWSRLRGRKGERCLMIGAGVLKGMRLVDFKSVLAHEYGHFQNEDTAGGGFALAVRRSMMQLIFGLAKGGAARWYNPTWWMARGFYALFMRMSLGASRLQEVLADRWAAFAYGGEAFESGLTHAVRRGVEFSIMTMASVNEALEEKRSIQNIYRLRPTMNASAKATIEDKIADALHRAVSPYDSHPPPHVRFELVRKLDAPIPEGEDRDAAAWDLFADRKDLERQLTRDLMDTVEERFHVSGLVVSTKEARGRQRRAARPRRAVEPSNG